jgi:DNA primase
LKRRDHVEVKSSPLTEVERVLLRALAIIDPEHEEARRLAAAALEQQPEWFDQLTAIPALRALAARRAGDPMEAVEDEAQRALLAQALLGETKPPDESLVQGTIDGLRKEWLDGQFRDVEARIKEAELRGDLAGQVELAQKRLLLNRQRFGS